MTDGTAALRAGRSVQDYCRPCKLERLHTVLTAPVADRPARVRCDVCGSQHNFRGGRGPTVVADRETGRRRPTGVQPDVFPLVSERERIAVSDDEQNDAAPRADAAQLELLIRRILREEGGLTPVAPAAKWIGGDLVLRPGREGVQEKTFPIETFFHKIVMLRNRLRVVEQQINASDLPADVKLKLQAQITGCYGSLTSFNVLFAEEDDRFRGASGKERA